MTAILDGAWGTELQSRGLDLQACPDYWNLLKPEAVISVAQAYAAAGSQIILTNTFRANRIALEHYGLAEHTRSINIRGVELSKRAAAGRAQVFASIGPSGRLPGTSEVTSEQLTTAFAEQAEALASAGADALVIETMSDPDEAAIAVQAARRTGLRIVASMVYLCRRDGIRTPTGATLEEVAAILEQAGAVIVGANCASIDDAINVCRRLVQTTKLPVWMKPNGGLPKIIDGKPAYTTSPKRFAECGATLFAEGADYVGGCCGTSPDFISALTRKVCE